MIWEVNQILPNAYLDHSSLLEFTVHFLEDVGLEDVGKGSGGCGRKAVAL